MAVGEQQNTRIEAGTEFEGKLSANCPVVVFGRVQGELTAPSVDVGESGGVCGNVTVQHLACKGEIAGVLEADTVQLSGHVEDGTVIRARSLEVALGAAAAFGNAELCVGDEPNKEEAIAAATSHVRSNASGQSARAAVAQVVSDDQVEDVAYENSAAHRP